MGFNRSRKETIDYIKYIKSRKKSGNHECQFCAIHATSPQMIRETKNFKVIRNIFPYSVWDGSKVADHLMLVPLLHTESLQTLPPEAMQEFTQLISEYESEGYNIYARSPHSSMKSVAHQHTHFIKPGKKHIRALFYIEKPDIRVIF